MIMVKAPTVDILGTISVSSTQDHAYVDVSRTRVKGPLLNVCLEGQILARSRVVFHHVDDPSSRSSKCTEVTTADKVRSQKHLLQKYEVRVH